MRKMIAIRMSRYGTRALRAGDEFEVPRRDAVLLERLGRAKPADTGKPKSKAKVGPEIEANDEKPKKSRKSRK